MVAHLEASVQHLSLDIKDRGKIFICNAVYEAANTNDTHTRETADAICSVIHERLGNNDPDTQHQPSHTVETWLVAHGHCKTTEATSETYAKIQAYRLAWVNELIREFSA